MSMRDGEVKRGRKRTCECGSCKKCRGRESKAKARAISSPPTEADRARRREYQRQWRAKNRDLARAQADRWAARNLEKRRAHQRVADALRRGRMERESCEVCGAERTHAHHDDYSKPLDVRWLCSVHHAEVHSCAS